MSKFQIITIAAFIFFIIVGVAAFATFKGGGGSANQIPPVTVWGTLPSATFTGYISKLNQGRSSPLSVTYVEKSPSAFSQEFIAALARGQGPDAIVIPADMLLPHIDKITPIPYSALPERSFKDMYIQEGEIYLADTGVNAVPFLVDPLVMYWNRDTFAGAGLATYPKQWNDFQTLIPKLLIKDQNGNIRKTALAMGDFTNVLNARELLGSIIMQVGNPITKNIGGFLSSTLKLDPSINSAVQFFTQFVDPNSPMYSWNRGMPDSKTAFLSAMSATYFGFASELNDIRAKNPNLNFDVAPLPQNGTAGIKAAYGRMYGFSIVRSSANANAAYQVFAVLTDPTNLAQLTQSLYLPTVRRDVIAQGSNDPYISIFNQAALISRTWLDADPSRSFRVFSNMINAITSGAKKVPEAVSDAGDEYDVVLKKAMQ